MKVKILSSAKSKGESTEHEQWLQWSSLVEPGYVLHSTPTNTNTSTRLGWPHNGLLVGLASRLVVSGSVSFVGAIVDRAGFEGSTDGRVLTYRWELDAPIW